MVNFFTTSPIEGGMKEGYKRGDKEGEGGATHTKAGRPFIF
jgi:hypothetical protein